MTVKDTKAALAVLGWKYVGTDTYHWLNEVRASARRGHVDLGVSVTGTGTESDNKLGQSARSALVQAIKEHWKA